MSGWKQVKHDRIGRAGVSGPEDLKAKALAALHRLQRLPHLIQGFFRDPNLRYITAWPVHLLTFALVAPVAVDLTAQRERLYSPLTVDIDPCERRSAQR
jgi:hypothetical protein